MISRFVLHAVAVFGVLIFACALVVEEAAGQNARADFNGDGYDDLAIGIPNKKVSGATGAGAVQVIYGGPTGLKSAGNQFITQSTSGIAGTSDTNDHFGAVLAAGDFNRDGYDELVVGSPFEDFTTGVFDDIDAGAFTVIAGSPSGLNPSASTLHSSADIPLIVRRDDEFLASGLAVGDLDSDGTDDLVVGRPGVNQVAFYFGDVGGGIPDGRKGGLVGNNFGGIAHTYAIGDFNSDSFGDVTVGVVSLFSDPPASGKAIVLLSNGSRDVQQDSEFLLFFDTSIVAQDHFSNSVVACDFDNDGFSDLAVGVPDKDDGSKTNSGAVSIFFGRASGGLDDVPVQRRVQTGSSTVTSFTGDRYGASVAAGDVNGDGFCDLVVGAPGRDVRSTANSGSAWVIYGSASRFSVSATVQEVNQDSATGIKLNPVEGTPEAGDLFGSTVTTGDFNGDGKTDLAIGAPGEAAGAGSGGVNVVYGSNTGLTFAGNQLWKPGTSGLPGGEVGDSFGSAFANASTRTPFTPGFSGVWSKERAACTDRGGRVRCIARARLLVTNPGAFSTRRSTVKVYRSTDSQLDASDKLITERRIKSLRPGKGEKFEIQTRGDEASVIGSRFIAVIDPDNRVIEADEENNIVTSLPLF